MTGVPYLVRLSLSINFSYLFFSTETITDHRARTLSNLLPIALATGLSEVEPDVEPLKVQYFIIILNQVNFPT